MAFAPEEIVLAVVAEHGRCGIALDDIVFFGEKLFDVDLRECLGNLVHPDIEVRDGVYFLKPDSCVDNKWVNELFHSAHDAGYVK